MASRKLTVEIIGDSSSLERALGKAQTKTSRFGKVAKTALIGGAAAGLYALGKAAKIGFDEFEQGQKVAAQTEAVLKSTGGAANVTAAHVEELGKALMNKSGIDDEVVKSGENVLLTFTKIRNEAGKGNDIFDQTTKVALDLSVALGQDLQSSAIQVGKALQDPQVGLTALRRVGVSFSDKQVELIQRLDATGHSLKAQKIILGELNKEFGGSAQALGETLPGKIELAKQKFANFAGDLVGKVIPALETVFEDISKAKSTRAKIDVVFAAGGDLLGQFEDLLFGHPSQRIRVPFDQRHFEWVTTPGDQGLVGAIGKAIRDINWTHVGELIGQGAQEVGQRGGEALADQLKETAKDKLQDPWGALVSAEKLQLQLLPFTHVWSAVWDGIEGDAKAATDGANKALDGMKPHLGSTASATRTFSGAMSEHLALVSGRARTAGSDIEQLRAVVTSLKSKAITVTARVEGLSYVAALQEHLSIIRSQGVNVSVGHNAGGTMNWRGGATWVGERGPELLNLPRGSQVVPHARAMAMAGASTVTNNFHFPNYVGGKRELIRVLREADAELSRSNGGQGLFS